MKLIYQNILYDYRAKEVQESVGVICKECNQTAYYFSINNTPFNCTKPCLICLKDKENGIILEDFISALSKYVKNHYVLTNKNDICATTSLKQILKRFTYDNEQVLEKLACLLCNKNNDFFKAEGFYKSTVDEVFIKKCKNEAIEKWNKLAKELKHSRRFSHVEAYEFYENLIIACRCEIDKKVIFNSALKKIETGTVFYRGRLIKNDYEKGIISSNPEVELSAPPEYLASNSRMSPPGISFMYMADKPETAIAELHPYVNDTVAIGKFVSTKELNFFDFTILDKILYRDANLLDDPQNDKYIKSRYLLDSLHELISRPFRATDTSYIETQMLAETIRNHSNSLFDGIIFGSSQLKDGLNYVLFGDSLEDSYNDQTIKDYHVKLNCEREIEFHKVSEMKATTEKLD